MSNNEILNKLVQDTIDAINEKRKINGKTNRINNFCIIDDVDLQEQSIKRMEFLLSKNELDAVVVLLSDLQMTLNKSFIKDYSEDMKYYDTNLFNSYGFFMKKLLISNPSSYNTHLTKEIKDSLYLIISYESILNRRLHSLFGDEKDIVEADFVLFSYLSNTEIDLFLKLKDLFLMLKQMLELMAEVWFWSIHERNSMKNPNVFQLYFLAPKVYRQLSIDLSRFF